jgi:hypothetical protein
VTNIDETLRCIEKEVQDLDAWYQEGFERSLAAHEEFVAGGAPVRGRAASFFPNQSSILKKIAHCWDALSQLDAERALVGSPILRQVRLKLDLALTTCSYQHELWKIEADAEGPVSEAFYRAYFPALSKCLGMYWAALRYFAICVARHLRTYIFIVCTERGRPKYWGGPVHPEVEKLYQLVQPYSYAPAQVTPDEQRRLLEDFCRQFGHNTGPAVSPSIDATGRAPAPVVGAVHPQGHRINASPVSGSTPAIGAALEPVGKVLVAVLRITGYLVACLFMVCWYGSTGKTDKLAGAARWFAQSTGKALTNAFRS